MMYLVSSYWRGALNIGDMRVVNNIAALEAELNRLCGTSDMVEFIDGGCYRVYKVELGQPVKIIKSKELKKLLENSN